MNKISLATLFAASLAAGCGDVVVVETTGGAGGSGGAGGTGGTITSTSTSTSTGTVPAECAVPTDKPGPYAITLRFVNPADNPVGGSVFLRQDCELNFEVRGCDDGYTAPIVLSGLCTTDCANANECIQCGACPELGVEVKLGESVEVQWDGSFFTFDENAVGCTCHVEHVAPAQSYQIRVPVFTSPDGAIGNAPDYQALHVFELPTLAGVVDVPLYAPPE